VSQESLGAASSYLLLHPLTGDDATFLFGSSRPLSIWVRVAVIGGGSFAGCSQEPLKLDMASPAPAVSFQRLLGQAGKRVRREKKRVDRTTEKDCRPRSMRKVSEAHLILLDGTSLIDANGLRRAESFASVPWSLCTSRNYIRCKWYNTNILGFIISSACWNSPVRLHYCTMTRCTSFIVGLPGKIGIDTNKMFTRNIG
jgi:hypothetical protein